MIYSHLILLYQKRRVLICQDGFANNDIPVGHGVPGQCGHHIHHRCDPSTTRYNRGRVYSAHRVVENTTSARRTVHTRTRTGTSTFLLQARGSSTDFLQPSSVVEHVHGWLKFCYLQELLVCPFLPSVSPFADT